MANKPTLVLGATGKTGRRVADGLQALGLPVRRGSRSGAPPFDWEDRATWEPVLQGAGAAYITYYPDLAVPGAAAAVEAFATLALDNQVRRLVLLSGRRGEEGAILGETAVQNSGADWTILRSSWFSQNFSEGFFVDQVLNGEIALPVGSVREPFIDVDDIAEAAVAALTDHRHVGRLYELTGPRLLTFAEATRQIAQAIGRDIRFVPLKMEQYTPLLAEQNVPADFGWLINYLFTDVLDGRNAYLTDGVQQALRRPPRDFADYVRDTAQSGIWSAAPTRTAQV
jgi:uncharacterized protein YbjT (DUF2867 family)